MSHVWVVPPSLTSRWLDDFIAGYGEDVDREIVRAWWAWRCLVVIRWLSENGYGSPEALPETAILRSLAG